MDEKKAFVFDTNFIIQNGQLTDVVANLSDRFTVYVTQISIDERIAQQCRELKSLFDGIGDVCKKYGKIADIKVTSSYEVREADYHAGIQKNYDELFKDRIIPFSKDADTFRRVLDRANRKLPPFATDENASDKGFKDTLIWLSLIDYFKSSGESEVVFVSDDKGFSKAEAALCEEFSEETGKSIAFKSNSYYKEILKPELVEEAPAPIPPPNLEEIRQRIESVITDLCYVQLEAPWGYDDWKKTFTISQFVDADYARVVFEELQKKRDNHIFEQSIRATDILGLDSRVVDTDQKIPMLAVDNALQLYKDLAENYPAFVTQFFSAVAEIINRNYMAAFAEVEEDGELPF